VVATVSLAVECWAFASARRAPDSAYLIAGKLSKKAWLGITGGAAAIGVWTMMIAVLPVGPFTIPFGGVISLAALVAALVYLAKVRPHAKGTRRPPHHPEAPGGW
jgi:hypothetical protein